MFYNSAFRLKDKVYELIFYDDSFDDLHTVYDFCYLLVFTGDALHGLIVGVQRYDNCSLQLTSDLNGDLLLGIYCLGLVILRPRLLTGHTSKALNLPKLLGDMRREGAEQDEQGLYVSPRGLVFVEGVDQRHECSNGGVELHALNILADLLYGLVYLRLVSLGVSVSVQWVLSEVPDPVEEALAALDRSIGPWNGLLEVADKHDIQTQGIRAEFVNYIVGVHDISPGL